MSFWAYCHMAWETAIAHKLRSALAVIGVGIAVAAVVGLSAVSTGSRDIVVRQLTSYGANLFEVDYGEPTRGNAVDSQLITEADVDAILRALKHVSKTVPMLLIHSPYRSGSRSGVWNVIGAVPDAVDTMGLKLLFGRFLVPEDDRQNVMVMGAPVAEELYGKQDVVGESIILSDRTFSIVGIVGRPSGIAASVAPASYIMIPLSTAERLSGNRTFTTVTFEADDPEEIPTLRDKAAAVLGSRHPGYSFPTSVVEHYADDVKQVFDVLTKVIVAVTSIALLVGGIGVTNIMLVSVTERTREIGVRKAIGASRSDILMQFLTEAVVICLTGGLIGLIVAIALVYAMGAFWFHFHLALPAVGVVGALGVSVVTGLFAGVYPAVRAAALDPVEALRYE